ncbi:MAG: M28 family peptidase [Candidatus Rokubacteria bacterium]|nr:M28 family peptidase [Candidatus Rokubacteria bacterium]
MAPHSGLAALARRAWAVGVVAVALALFTTAVFALRASAGAGERARVPVRFDGTRVLKHVERLVALGPRPAGSAAAERARKYIVGELKRSGVSTRVQAFEADTPHGRLTFANVIGVLPGARPDVIMIAGHYDTKWFPDFRFVGANDGGSSTALLLELARVLASRPRGFTYWVVFFDGEEARETWTATDSLYGSRHLAAELARTGKLPRALIVADMIGDRNLGIRRETASTPWLTDLVWNAARRLRYDAHFLPDALPVEDDHVPFLRARVPATLLIDFDYPPWHTPADTIDKVSADSLRIVGEVILDALPAIEDRVGQAGGASKR